MLPLAVGAALVGSVTARRRRKVREQRAPMWNLLADEFGATHPPAGVEFLATKCFDLRVQISRSIDPGSPLQIEVVVPLPGSKISVTAFGEGLKPNVAWLSKKHPELDIELLSQLEVSGDKAFLQFLTPARQRALMAMARDHKVFTLRQYHATKGLGVFKVLLPAKLDNPAMVERAGAMAVKLAGNARVFLDG